MNKILTIALFLLAVLSLQNEVQGQVRKNIVKVNPLSVGVFTLNGSYERVVSERIALQLGAFVPD